MFIYDKIYMSFLAKPHRIKEKTEKRKKHTVKKNGCPF